MSISAALSIARRYRSGGRVETNPPMRIKKHINFQGLQISIETPKGEIRRGIDHEGKPWANRMAVDYGYIRRTEGKDGDQVDVFVGPNRRSDKVFIIDQLHHHMEKFDEHKCLVGFNNKKQALTAYHASYGRKYGAHHTVGAVTELSIDAFKEWLKGGGGKKPVSPEVPQYQTGGAVEPFDEFQMQREAALAKPPTPEEPQYPMEPSLQEAQMGQQELPEGTAVNEAGEIYRKDTGEVIPQTRRPGFLPITKTPAGHYEAAMPKIFDIAGNMGAGWSVPVRGAEAILGAGLAIPKAAKGVGKTAWDLHPDEVASALQTSGTKGTSAGGIFSGFSDGIDRYVKIAKSLEHAKEEVLASKLYELAGVRAAKTELTELNGKPAVASQIIPKASQLSEFVPEQYNSINGLKEDFPAHAWLANWDAPGVGSENPLGNIMVAPIGGGQWGAHYVDFGGALRFRGLGGEKGDLFGPKVTETKLMLGPTAKNPLVASVFEGHQIGPDNPVAQRIANITNDQIRDLVNIYGPKDDYERASLLAKLIDRRDDLAKQYGIEKPHIVGGTDIEKPPLGMNVPPKPIANALMASFKDSADPAYEISEAIWKLAEKQGYKKADAVVKELPSELHADIDNHLGVKAYQEGYSPWPEMGVDRPVSAQPVEKKISVPSLMQINKTHSLPEILHSIKKYNWDTLDPKALTDKQSDKIRSILFKLPFETIANTMADAQLTSKQADNILSWFPKEHAKAIDDLYDKQIGGGLEPGVFFEKTMKAGLQANKPHWWVTFQRNYEKYYNQLANYYNLPAKTYDQIQADRIAGGFTTPVVSGIRPEHGVIDPFHEHTQFHSNMIDVAHAYSVYKNSAANPKWWDKNPNSVLSEYEHAAIQPLYLNTKNYIEVDADGRSFSYGNDLAWEARKKVMNEGKDPDGVIIRNVHDMPMPGPSGGYEHPSGEPFTVYQSWNPATRRSKWARFDPENWTKTGLHLGIAGTMVGGLGLTGTKGNGILIDREQPQYARGGAAKATKETANYRLGTKAEHCAICTMFRAPDSCTAVQGKIRRQDTCDYFEKIKGMARGGQTRTYTMPLKPGSSEKVKSQNISEFHTGPTYAHTRAKFGKARADRQAIAVALSNARKYGKKKAFGGPNIESMIMRGSSYKLGREGMINSSIPGRTDKLPMNVKAGSYVLPADIPSALGQGNTMAGGEILKKMFSSGPYGMAAPRGGRGTLPRPLSLRAPAPKMRANGGEASDKDGSHVPIIAAGGEYIIHPEVVRDIGHGDIKAGHKVLDKFVLNVRKKNIETLKKLPGPKR